MRLIGDIRKHNPVTSLSNGQATALADMVGNDAKAPVKKLDAHDIAKYTQSFLDFSMYGRLTALLAGY